MKSNAKQEWILLVHQLPQKPSNLRVRTWRRLRNIGAISIKNAVYVLPFNDKTSEDFQWLKQEIESVGGEASLFRAGSVEGASDGEIVALFCQQRDEDYAHLIGEFERSREEVREEKRAGVLPEMKAHQLEAELRKLRHELDRVAAVDFFDAPKRKEAEDAFEKFRKELQTRKGKSDKNPATDAGQNRVTVADFQNRRWVTRKDPHIDRLASAWLIKRFIDRRPHFQFVLDGERVEHGVTFDMSGGDFTHQGADCTFETMVKSFGLGKDKALRQVAEIVHDIDLKDEKFERPEADGINAVIRGLSEVYENDGERVRACRPVFDGLYELFSEKGNKEIKKPRGISSRG